MFALGRLCISDLAAEAFERNEQDPLDFLARHKSEDWGDVSEQSKKDNVYAIHNNERVISAYKLKDNTIIWISTEHDRSATTIFLPWEF